MTALLTARHDQNWGDALVMVGVASALVGFSLIEVAAARFAAWRDTRANHDAIRTHVHERPTAYIPLRSVEVDHEACTGDGCGNTVCFCRQRVTCAGAVNVGCLHLTWVGVLCTSCRGECPECRHEDVLDRGYAIEAGR